MTGRSWRRSNDDDNSILSQIPPGVNPFTYITNVVTAQYYVPLPTASRSILMVFFSFHVLIATFCLVLLLLPFLRGVTQSQWLFRRLYIKDHKGGTVHKVPLFWLNAGVLMTAFQFLSSLGSQAFIFMQIKSALSPNYALHSQLEPALGFIYTGEMLTYWSLMHCFLVATYYGNEAQGNTVKGMSQWTPSPTVLNAIFIGFPAFIIAISIALFAWLSVAHSIFTSHARKVLHSLNEGAMIWEQERDPSTPIEAKTDLMTQLFQVMTQTKSFRDQAEFYLSRLIYCFHVLQFVLMVLLCITFLSFLSFFCVLVSKYQKSKSQSSNRLPSQLSSSGETTLVASRSLIHIAKSDRQFLHLMLRSIAMIVGMMTMMALFLIGIVRSTEVIRDPRYRGIAAWLATTSGTWSAIPITWQCWGLYNDNLRRAAPDSPKPTDTQISQFSTGRRGSDISGPWDDRESEDIEFKALPEPRNPFRA
ncbi:hypothetical protein PCANC_13195 [Puccinia coronata f. sp. avenae]|uniref:Uncharacterized protein n=2 Tax=Puccinia coronata f. sp. avenae TaxID=200324 RepID=A0A2N5V051_9BASI|nr:hypothetical protein PCANC_13195 [Puccinia coronata f. sp. avenae]